MYSMWNVLSVRNTWQPWSTRDRLTDLCILQYSGLANIKKHEQINQFLCVVLSVSVRWRQRGGPHNRFSFLCFPCSSQMSSSGFPFVCRTSMIRWSRWGLNVNLVNVLLISYARVTWFCSCCAVHSQCLVQIIKLGRQAAASLSLCVCACIIVAYLRPIPWPPPWGPEFLAAPLTVMVVLTCLLTPRLFRMKFSFYIFSCSSKRRRNTTWLTCQ